MKIDFHPDAQQEFIEASRYYDARVPGLGAQYITELERLIELLKARPGIGMQVDETFRRAVFRRFPFTLMYSVEGNRIRIVAVAHQHRLPGYWRQRSSR